MYDGFSSQYQYGRKRLVLANNPPAIDNGTSTRGVMAEATTRDEKVAEMANPRPVPTIEANITTPK